MLRLVQSLLDKFSEMLSTINTINPSPLINPSILFICSLIVAIIVAFSRTFYSSLMGFLFLMILLLLLQPKIKPLFHSVMVISLFAIVPGIPLLFSHNMLINGLEDLSISVSYKGAIFFVEFFLRVTSSSLIIAIVIVYIGWQGLGGLFNKLKLNKVYFFLNIVIISIPKLVRYLLYFLIARESRTINNDLREKWQILASVIGDTIIVSSWMGKITGMAISARTISIPIHEKKTVTVSSNDISFIILSTLFVLIMLLMEMGYLA